MLLNAGGIDVKGVRYRLGQMRNDLNLVIGVSFFVASLYLWGNYNSCFNVLDVLLLFLGFGSIMIFPGYMFWLHKRLVKHKEMIKNVND